MGCGGHPSGLRPTGCLHGGRTPLGRRHPPRARRLASPSPLRREATRAMARGAPDARNPMPAGTARGRGEGARTAKAPWLEAS
eukprot:6557158-Alexandrium_andersonii.AAC.1